MKHNEHYMYLCHQMNFRIYNDGIPSYKSPEELPGMVYGMWNNAWDQLLDDMQNEGLFV